MNASALIGSGSSEITSLKQLRSDRPRTEASSTKQQNKADEAFEKLMQKPLSKEASGHVMTAMKETLETGKSGPDLDEERLKVYNQIQNYKNSSFKNRVLFNKRVNLESDLKSLQRELQSIKNQINAQNAKKTMLGLNELLLNTIASTEFIWNKGRNTLKDLPTIGKQHFADGYCDEEITELSIKYADWLAQGPEVRYLLGLWQLIEKTRQQSTVQFSNRPADTINKESLSSDLYADL